MKNVMIDLKTMGVEHDAAIIQIGACFFDEKEIGSKFICNIDL